MLFLSSIPSPADNPEAPAKSTGQLQQIVDSAAQMALRQFSAKGLKAENLAITLIDLSEATHPTASVNGDKPIYPASVVKLFYLAATERWLEDGRLQDSPELRRGLRDMIVDSTNDATGYILDALTGTTSGPELSPDELKAWSEKRNQVNRFFAELGYSGINVNQKTWNEGPYGRERQFLGANYENRNKLTTNATARLLAQTALGQWVSPERSRPMMELLKRDHTGKSDSQASDFTGIALKEIPGAKFWSKAGWTSTARHDAAYIELPNHKRFVLVVFTTGAANQKEIIPAVARAVIAKLPSDGENVP
jgi:beta-lactamase class A